MTLAIPEAITTIAEAERRFNLSRTEDELFFLEWQTMFPELSTVEKFALDDVRRCYLYQRSEGQLLEGTVTLLLASPLLAIAKLRTKSPQGFMICRFGFTLKSRFS
ncbi:MAG: hypothetical protein WCD18_00220 [Thermosynechococcaceae cyanobacterium]